MGKHRRLWELLMVPVLHTAAHASILAVDTQAHPSHPCHLVKDSSDCLDLQESCKPFATGGYKSKQGSLFQTFYF